MYMILDIALGLVIPGLIILAAFALGWAARGAHDTRAASRVRADARRRGQRLPPSDPSAQPSHVSVAQFGK